MNKKIIIGIVVALLVAIIGSFGIYVYNRYFPSGKTNAPTKTKEPEEQVKVEMMKQRQIKKVKNL